LSTGANPELAEGCKGGQSLSHFVLRSFNAGGLTLFSSPLLGCVIFQTTGEVYIDNILANGLSEKELANLRLNNIGFVFQSFNLLVPLNALENVMQPLRLAGTSKKEAKLKAEDALKR
jgi:putative ABC transport system ATP-binding protein